MKSSGTGQEFGAAALKGFRGHLVDVALGDVA